MAQRSDFEILRDLDRALDELPEDKDPNVLIEKAKQVEQGGNMPKVKDKESRTPVGSWIDKELWQYTKIRAVQEGRSAGHVLDDAIRLYKQKVEQQQEKEKA